MTSSPQRRPGDQAGSRSVGDHELIVAWRNSPHVSEWWDPDDPPLTWRRREEFRRAADGSHPTITCIIERSGKPVGFLQFYPWDGEREYLEEVGVSSRQEPGGSTSSSGSRARRPGSVRARSGWSRITSSPRRVRRRWRWHRGDKCAPQAAYARAGMHPVGDSSTPISATVSASNRSS